MRWCGRGRTECPLARRSTGWVPRHRTTRHDRGVTDSGGTWYYAWLPGPWLRIRGPEWPQPLGFDYANELLEVECELCGLRREMSAAVDEGERNEAREHWERHVDGQVPVPFFRLPGVGDVKQLSTGTWADVLEAMPYLLLDRSPIPPLDVANEILATGFDDAGMSGGCEWPRHTLSLDEYAVLRKTLVERGCLDVEPLEPVTTRDAYERWKWALRRG